jgi:retinol dehydrogenase-13
MVFSKDSSNTQNSDTQVYMVTGATGAIGKAIARQLAETQNSEIVLTCCDADKAEKTVQEIIDLTENTRVRFELANLSLYADIRHLVEGWTGPLHVLINNAACTPRSREETADGIEMQFATNVLGYFWLTNLFTPKSCKHYPPHDINSIINN